MPSPNKRTRLALLHLTHPDTPGLHLQKDGSNYRFACNRGGQGAENLIKRSRNVTNTTLRCRAMSIYDINETTLDNLLQVMISTKYIPQTSFHIGAITLDMLNIVYDPFSRGVKLISVTPANKKMFARIKRSREESTDSHCQLNKRMKYIEGTVQKSTIGIKRTYREMSNDISEIKSKLRRIEKSSYTQTILSFLHLLTFILIIGGLVTYYQYNENIEDTLVTLFDTSHYNWECKMIPVKNNSLVTIANINTPQLYSGTTSLCV